MHIPCFARVSGSQLNHLCTSVVILLECFNKLILYSLAWVLYIILLQALLPILNMMVLYDKQREFLKVNNYYNLIKT